MRRTKFEIPEEEVRFRFSTSGGPGGQHANKANTRVELGWEVTETTVLTAKEKALLIERLGPSIRIVVSEYRSQKRNRQLRNLYQKNKLLRAFRANEHSQPDHQEQESVHLGFSISQSLPVFSKLPGGFPD